MRDAATRARIRSAAMRRLSIAAASIIARTESSSQRPAMSVNRIQSSVVRFSMRQQLIPRFAAQVRSRSLKWSTSINSAPVGMPSFTEMFEPQFELHRHILVRRTLDFRVPEPMLIEYPSTPDKTALSLLSRRTSRAPIIPQSPIALAWSALPQRFCVHAYAEETCERGAPSVSRVFRAKARSTPALPFRRSKRGYRGMEPPRTSFAVNPVIASARLFQNLTMPCRSANQTPSGRESRSSKCSGANSSGSVSGSPRINPLVAARSTAKAAFTGGADQPALVLSHAIHRKSHQRFRRMIHQKHIPRFQQDQIANRNRRRHPCSPLTGPRPDRIFFRI